MRMIPKQSPFITHKDKILGGYGTARWMRQLVLAMWNGDKYKAGMSKLSNLDDAHFNAAIELMTWYREHGENDPDFIAVAEQCVAMDTEELQRAERHRQFEEWEQNVKSDLYSIGADHHQVDDYYQWYLSRFEAGDTPLAAAQRAMEKGIAPVRRRT